MKATGRLNIYYPEVFVLLWDVTGYKGAVIYQQFQDNILSLLPGSSSPEREVIPKRR